MIRQSLWKMLQKRMLYKHRFQKCTFFKGAKKVKKMLQMLILINNHKRQIKIVKRCIDIYDRISFCINFQELSLIIY